MSAKSSVKALIPAGSVAAEGKLFQWVAVLTGSKNALKGVGFFLGGVLLATLGFAGAMWAMAGVLFVVWIASLISLKSDLGKAKNKPKFGEIFSTSRAVNILSAARLFLFGARDVWFVVALPVFMATTLGWADWAVGTFFACWVIGYGIVQSLAPYLTGKKAGKVPDGRAAMLWAIPLAVSTVGIALVSRDNIAGFEREVQDGGEAHWVVVLRDVPERLPVSRRQQHIIKDFKKGHDG